MAMRGFFVDKWRELLVLFSLGTAWLIATIASL